MADKSKWAALVAGAGCPLDAPRPPSNEHWDLVGQLSVSSLYLTKNQTYRGQCQLIFDSRHVARIDQLSRVQAPACDRRVVRQDLAQPWTSALIGAGFDPARKAAFLAEGLLYYLDESAVISLFDALRSVAAPGSWLGLDAMNPEVLTSPFMATYLKRLAELGCPWKFGVADPDALLASKGWESNVVFPGEPEASYGRWVMPAVPRAIPGLPRTFLIRARRMAD